MSMPFTCASCVTRMPVSDGALSIWMGMIMYVCLQAYAHNEPVSDSSSGRTMLIEAFSARVRRCKALWTKAKTPGTMGDIWKADEAVNYIEGDVVLKARVKRRLETGEDD